MAKRYNIKIGTQNYILKEDLPITFARKERLLKHPQANSFHFKSSRGRGFYWFVKSSGSSYGMTSTGKKENQLLEASYSKLLNKNDTIV